MIESSAKFLINGFKILLNVYGYISAKHITNYSVQITGKITSPLFHIGLKCPLSKIGVVRSKMEKPL